MRPLFPGSLVEVARKVRDLYPVCGYDPSPHYPPSGPFDPLHLASDDLFARGYAGIKYAVAKVLQPARIVEVGVGAGVSARAFLAACPHSRYVGIDSDRHRTGSVREARDLLSGFAAEVLLADSASLSALPLCDLCHVDGCHEYDTCLHDVSLALRAAEWVLVDDARDSQVAAATLRACFEWRPGDLDWCVFEDTWTGSLLIHTTIDRNGKAEFAPELPLPAK